METLLLTVQAEPELPLRKCRSNSNVISRKYYHNWWFWIFQWNAFLGEVYTSGSNPQTLTAFTGTTTLTVGPGSAFGGNVTFTAPRLFLNGCTYSGTAALEKNGASDDAGAGGIFLAELQP